MKVLWLLVRPFLTFFGRFLAATVGTVVVAAMVAAAAVVFMLMVIGALIVWVAIGDLPEIPWTAPGYGKRRQTDGMRG